MTAEDELFWDGWRTRWSLRADTLYLNHGSFGPAPDDVLQAQREYKRRLDEQPMDFYVRQFEPEWKHARQRLAEFVGTSADNLAFVENATYGMNVIANSISLAAGEEVVLTDHEYGAVVRIWNRACQRADARTVVASLPDRICSEDELVDAITSRFTARTRVLVVSHVTSPTAIIFPIERICREARRRGVVVCIDGPHAPLQVELDIDSLDCDFYTASCHKWLSAPLGSGFLHVAPRHQSSVRPPLLSWGVLLPREPDSWSDEFIWTGTRDPSPYLAIPAALDFVQSIGAARFRQRTHDLAQYARQRLVDAYRMEPLVPDNSHWYGSMAHVPIPNGERGVLQEELWKQFGIEVPIIHWKDQRYIRVSCHLYNQRQDIDRLIEALGVLIA